MLRVSVLIVTLKSGDELLKTVRSCLNQAIPYAIGELAVFRNCSDFFSKNMLQDIVKKIKKNFYHDTIQ